VPKTAKYPQAGFHRFVDSKLVFEKNTSQEMHHVSHALRAFARLYGQINKTAFGQGRLRVIMKFV